MNYRISLSEKLGWSCASDVGKTVTPADYLKYEEAYLSIVTHFATMSNSSLFEIIGWEDGPNEQGRVDNGIIYEYRLLKEPSQGNIFFNEFLTYFRGLLRGNAWFRIESKTGFYAHVGYDYVLWVGAPDIEIDKTIEGIDVMECPSPYFDEGWD